MLSSELLPKKTIEMLMDEAIMQIPLYTDEWTNFNPSDPGITTLENLSVYSVLQQDKIDQIPESVREKLFEIAGFSRQHAKSSRVLVEARHVESPVVVPAGQKFMVGNLSFETNRKNHLRGYQFTGLFREEDGKIADLSYVLDPDVPIAASILGKEPKEGTIIYLVANGLGNPSDEVMFHVDVEDAYGRNPIDENQPFAEIQWQCYTKKGFINVKAVDCTSAFLKSGTIKIRLPKTELDVCDLMPEHGYVLRGVIKKANYDIPPRVSGISGFLFEMWQKDTKAMCYTFPNTNEFEVYSDILEDGYWQLYCKESDEYFHKYELTANNADLQGRYYWAEKLGFGHYRFHLQSEKSGYGPGNYVNAIKFIAYNEEAMPHYHLGKIYGYLGQKMDLPFKNLIKEGFNLIARRTNAQGESIYDFIKPDSEKETEFCYRLMESEGKIQIEEANDFIGATLFVCVIAQTSGEVGNVRVGSRFVPVGYNTEIEFVNPVAGSGGRLMESINDIRKRFVKDIGEQHVAIEASDYENIVKTTPGLCIHKVHAVLNQEKKQVEIAVKPYGTTERTVMSSLYKELIEKRLDKHRLLATKIELLQPVYAEIGIRGTIYVKPHYKGAEEKIVSLIERELDYLSADDKNFGDRLVFGELFHKIEMLECVEFIYELNATSQNPAHTKTNGIDIVPKANCLLLPGKIELNISTLE